MTNEKKMRARIEELEMGIADARLFAVWVESIGRTDCEVYKHELQSSALLTLERIDKLSAT